MGFALDNPGIAKILSEIADLLEIKGENPFKIRAYRNVSDIAVRPCVGIHCAMRVAARTRLPRFWRLLHATAPRGWLRSARFAGDPKPLPS